MEKKQKNIPIQLINSEVYFTEANFQEVIVPVLCEQSTFTDKAGPEILGQMWTFKDKGDRDVCLIPEVTGVIQELYRNEWQKSLPKPIKVFYVSRCYRYEKPQLGRYREFTQFGIEILGGSNNEKEVIELLEKCLNNFNVNYEMSLSVKRGLSYYVENGFEAICNELGAQKQIAGGGKYSEGIGWAIGIDRLLLAKR